jgi:hypothetical protein
MPDEISPDYSKIPRELSDAQQGADKLLEADPYTAAPGRDAVQELFDTQADCQVWFDNLPEALKDSTLAEHLREVCELDLSPLDAVLPPKGFGLN